MSLIKDIVIFPWDDIKKVIRTYKQRETIYARKCKIRHVPKENAKEFLNEHHLQNYARCSIFIGLYFNDELVSIMTFGKPRYNKNYDYELIRYCSIKNVIGGAQKLLTNFIREYKPKTIVSYCDKSKFTGDTYLKLGFKLIKDGRPSKHWYNMQTKEHYTDALIRQQGFSRVIHHKDASEENLHTNNNRQLMLEEGFVEVYDCGQSTYILEIQ